MYTYTSVDFESVEICTDSLYIEDETQITPRGTLIDLHILPMST